MADYRFPRNAEVWLEAHRQNLWMQFAWGTISAMRPPSNRRLTEFDVPDGILFRVRVVQPPGNEHHKLLGEADGIQFVKAGEATDKRRPLLEPVPEALDQLLWKLDMESDPPRLLVNKDAKPTWKDLARSQHFLSLVYPEVLRRILAHILIEDAWVEDDEEPGWQADWVRFARNLGVSTPLPNPDQKQDREAWTDEAVATFAHRHELRAKLDLVF
ncbi:MAG: hypothetical protein MUE94_01770 [Verrucomicrobia bacterium]|nr:hypothetical protein [Verrucomicrobiota bacterium]